MTKIEVQIITLNSLNLKVDDRIKLNDRSSIYTIKKNDTEFYLLAEEGYKSLYDIGSLISYGFEKVNPKKKLGDIKCDDINCHDCPFNCIECGSGVTLFDILEDTKKQGNMPEEIYLACMKLLDKEVEDEKTETSKKD